MQLKWKVHAKRLQASKFQYCQSEMRPAQPGSAPPPFSSILALAEELRQREACTPHPPHLIPAGISQPMCFSCVHIYIYTHTHCPTLNPCPCLHTHLYSALAPLGSASDSFLPCSYISIKEHVTPMQRVVEPGLASTIAQHSCETRHSSAAHCSLHPGRTLHSYTAFARANSAQTFGSALCTRDLHALKSLSSLPSWANPSTSPSPELLWSVLVPVLLVQAAALPSSPAAASCDAELGFSSLSRSWDRPGHLAFIIFQCSALWRKFKL